MKKNKLKRGAIVKHQDKYALFLKTENRWAWIITFNGKELEEMIRVKRKELSIVNNPPPELEMYNIA
jgi:uncharacterized lipoprotein YmbA